MVDPDIFLDPEIRWYVNNYHVPLTISEFGKHDPVRYYCRECGYVWPCPSVKTLREREMFEDLMKEELKDENLKKDKKKKGKGKK